MTDFVVVTFSKILNDELGHPDIFGYPHRLCVGAIPKTEHVTAPTVAGAGAGRSLEWILEWGWDDDDD